MIWRCEYVRAPSTATKSSTFSVRRALFLRYCLRDTGTQKTAMEKQTVRLQQGLEEERSKRESAETTIEALIASAKAQAETAQLAFEQMEQQMQQMEGEIESARSSTISSDREALRLAIEARKREALEREALQKALDEKKLGDEEDAAAEDDETRYVPLPTSVGPACLARLSVLPV